jgi:hypothetical protein
VTPDTPPAPDSGLDVDPSERPPEASDRRSPPPDPPDEPAVCGYCDARFADEQLLALHRGLEHEPELTAAERDAYDEAVDAERDDLRLFRLQSLVALLVIYFGFVIVYAFVL